MTTRGRVLRTRSDRLVARAVGDEVVVYDARTDQAHLLNPVAGRIWALCERGATAEEVIAVEREHSGDDAPAVVGAALDELASLGLLEGTAVDEPARAPTGISRRDMLRKIGIAAALAPFVTTILAPTPAAAQVSGPPCSPPGQTCSTNGQCCSGTCTGGLCACRAVGGACGVNSTCCSNNCVGGTCQCRANGALCSSGTQCCGGVCTGGVCCKGTNVACATNADCCSGICFSQTGTCQCIPNGFNAACTSNSQCCGGTCGSNSRCCTTSVETNTSCSSNAGCCGGADHVCNNNRCCLSNGSANHGGVASRCCANRIRSGLCNP